MPKCGGFSRRHWGWLLTRRAGLVVVLVPVVSDGPAGAGCGVGLLKCREGMLLGGGPCCLAVAGWLAGSGGSGRCGCLTIPG